MKDLKKYDIDIIRLSNKQHAYEFESGSSFFECFEHSLITKGQFKTHLLLDKHETLIQLNFHITGTVELLCDRTLEPFEYPIDIHQKLILKYGEENKELTDEIEIIARDTQRINVAQYIYEFIGLSVPMKKLHPRLRNEKPTVENDEGILVYRSETPPDTSDEEGGDNDTNIDPRWQALKNLRNTNGTGH